MNSITVYIDWNQNGLFTDTGENYPVGTIANSSGVDAVSLTGTIAVPATATVGTTRIRLVKNILQHPAYLVEVFQVLVRPRIILSMSMLKL